jgi:DNA-binding GntR family transcriptional regulator
MAQSVEQVDAGGSLSSAEESRWVTLDTTFHIMLLRASRNRRALKAVADLRVMSRIFGHRREAMSVELMRRVLREHRAIIDAVAGGDRAAARRLLAHHIRQGREGALAAYAQRRRQREAGQVIADLPQSLRETIRRIETGRNQSNLAAVDD